MTNMKIRLLSLLAIGALAVLLAFGRNPSPIATGAGVSPAHNYEYKVELVKHNKDLEGVLQTNARNGWRLRDVVIGPFHNELVVVLEKGGVSP